MKIIGLTGLMASGKTAALRVMEAMGAWVISADKAAHRVIMRGGAAYGGIVDAFGPDILVNGEIDRKRLGDIVFADKERLLELNALTHKYVIQDILNEIEDVRRKAFTGIALEVIYLFETGLADVCDARFIIVADEAERIRRIVERDRMSFAAAERRVLSQAGFDWSDKLGPRDRVIANNGDIAEFRLKVEALARDVFV